MLCLPKDAKAWHESFETPLNGPRQQGQGKTKQEDPMAQKALFRAIVQETGMVLADRISIADSPAARARGLLGRMGLEDGQGLLIKPCSSIHMFFMKFPIDVLFLSRDGMVIKMARGLKPWRLCGCWFGCYMVLELKEGALPGTDDFIKKHINIVEK